LAPSAVADDVRSQQWYLDKMLADRLWKVSTGKGIKVAVVDSGVNPSTASLTGKVLKDEVPAAAAYGATKDFGGHGTSMAELIAGSGAGGGLQGLAPGARIIPVRAKLDQLKDRFDSPGDQGCCRHRCTDHQYVVRRRVLERRREKRG
jgi:subtilisin family serine protease